MTFDVTAELTYDIQEPATLLLNLHALKRNQIVVDESFVVEPGHFYDEIIPSQEGNRLIRMNIPQPCSLQLSYRASVSTYWQLIELADLGATPISSLPADVFTYLNPSRYCQSDKLFRFADHQFSSWENDFDKVRAVVDWIYNHVEYISGSTNSETSAYDTITQEAGVCRDFAHLGIALCRAMTIPARYCSVYAYLLQPQDFHACFEAYIHGHWIMFDATKLAPLNGLVRIGTGRDAADVAFSNLFGEITSGGLQVQCSLTGAVLYPVFYGDGQTAGLSFQNPPPFP